MTNEQKETASN